MHAFGARHVEQGADATPGRQFLLIDLDVVGPRGIAVGELRQLAEFLRKRHLLEECRHSCVDLLRIENAGRSA